MRLEYTHAPPPAYPRDALRRGAEGTVLLQVLVGTDAGEVALYVNLGTRAVPRFVRDSGFSLRVPGHATPAVGDLTGDGIPDLVIGTSGGGAVFFQGRR